MKAVEFRVLGPLEVRLDGAALRIPVGRQRQVLAVLLLAPGHVVSIDRLIDALWGENPPADARAALHTSVARLRRSLGPLGGSVVHRPPGYVLEVSTTALDAERFTGLCRQAAAADPATAISLLDQALALWRGQAWGELADDVARSAALRLEEQRLQAEEQRARAMVDAGRLGEAVAALETLLAEHPLREHAVAELMDCLHRQGRTAAALDLFGRHRRHLADELGLDPAAEVVAVHARVLRQEAPGAPTGAAALAPRDPPAASRRGTPPPLPLSAASLVGREGDAAALRRLLAAERLVTVVGPGGVGKTRLVHHVAADSGEPVWWADLAAVDDGSAVPQVLAEALGAEAQPGSSPAEALRQRFAHTTGLVVLDNCEHLIGPIAAVAAELLGVPSAARLLATSRERLAIPGERVLALAPLPLDDEPGDGERGGDEPGGGEPGGGERGQVEPDAAEPPSPAVALFLDRARAADPELALTASTRPVISRVCRELDGLPLAIELAAARVGTLTIDDLAERLDARFELLGTGARTAQPRHQGLRAVIDWSYQLLEPDEQAVFRRLGVFAARFDLAAAEAVAADQSIPSARVADVVARLADRSMLMRPGGSGRGRYRMLETLRQYALTRLDAQELAEVRQRHADWAVRLAEQAEIGLLGPDEAHWAAVVDEAMGDLRAAWHWASAEGNHEHGARLAAALARWAFWRRRSDVLDWGAQVGRWPGPLPRLAVAGAAAATAAWASGRITEARQLSEQAIERAGDDDPRGAALALETLGDVCLVSGDLDDAVAAYGRAREQAMRAAAEAGDQATRAALLGEAAVYRASEAIAGAYAGRPMGEVIEAALADAQTSGNPSCLAFALYCQGDVVADADPVRALAALSRAQGLADQVDNRLVSGLARTAAVSLTGRHAPPGRASYQLFHEVISHWRSTGSSTLLRTTLRNLVPLLSRAGADGSAIELATALDSFRHEHESYGGEAERLAAAVAASNERLGPAATAAATAAAARIADLDQAAERALLALAELTRRSEAIDLTDAPTLAVGQRSASER